MNRATPFIAFAITALLIACGGGGGGTNTASQVGFALTSPKAINFEVYERTRIPDVSITGNITGDAKALSGKSLYFVISLPDAGLFSSQTAVNIDPSGLSGNIQLFGATPPDGSKTYSGTMSVRAYLDPSLQNPLNVENGNIPYTIHVKTGLKAATSEVTIRTTFGKWPPDLILPITLPEDISSWDVHTDPTGSEIKARKVEDGTDKIILSVEELVIPSTYTDTVWLSAITRGGTTLSTSIKANYITDPSDVPFVFSKPSASFVCKEGDPTLPAPIDICAQFPKMDSDRFHYIDTTFTWPSAANSNDHRTSWLASSQESPNRWPTYQYFMKFQPYTYNQGVYYSLPSGTYTASLHYRYSPLSGQDVDVNFLVTLNIVP